MGRQLSVSRTAIWKALQYCESLGLELHSVRGRGYRLAHPLELLDEEIISQHCSRLPVKISLHQEIDSTNRWLLQQDNVHAHACFAERQTQGRGRRGRQWVSPFAANIYLSLGWRFDSGPASLGGLSLAVGVAVIRALRSSGIDEAGLKWPNDIIARGAKLGGILLELRGETEGPCEAIIGVGLNVAMPPMQADSIEQKWIDVRALDENISRNQLAGALLAELQGVLQEFTGQGFESLHAEWQSLDVYRGKEVELDNLRGKVRGVVRGVDNGGALLLECREGVRRFNAGEVSLREG